MVLPVTPALCCVCLRGIHCCSLEKGFRGSCVLFKPRLALVGGSWWRLAVGGPWRRSLRAVLNKKKSGFLRIPLPSAEAAPVPIGLGGWGRRGKGKDVLLKESLVVLFGKTLTGAWDRNGLRHCRSAAWHRESAVHNSPLTFHRQPPKRREFGPRPRAAWRLRVVVMHEAGQLRGPRGEPRAPLVGRGVRIPKLRSRPHPMCGAGKE